MSSQRGEARDLWAEIVSEGEEKEEGAQIAVVYGRRRVADQNHREVQIEKNRLIRENRVSFAPTKRISWRRSLSIRGRESIIVATGFDFIPEPKRRGAQRKPKKCFRSKKDGKKRPDLSKEKAYFEEVDSFELVEESPSPKKFGIWTMGTKYEYVVPDLPAILERWKIFKLGDSCGSSQQLFKIMETPLVPSADSVSGNSSALIEKGPEGAWILRFSNFTSKERSATLIRRDASSVQDLNEGSILSSLSSLRIKDEDDVCEGIGTSREDVGKGIDGAIRKESFDLRAMSFTGGCFSAFTQLLMVCRQSAPVKLSEAFSVYCDPSSILKIGEGTYGEAFRAGETVCKVVPIDGDLMVNGEIQKKSEEVIEEVLLSLTLNSLRDQSGEANAKNSCTSFIETKDLYVCQGTYDAHLIHAWEDWDEKHRSENDHPKEFPEDQCYIVFVLADGGKDLESFVLQNYDEARSLLVQVTAALAVAEVACEFEHRDLHWGNILLSRNETTTMNFTLERKKMSVKTHGTTISIIDFTLSRINTGEAILFLDLSADPELFKGPKGDIQSETYRKMKKVTDECWEGSFPKTNVLWLIYLVDILLMKKSFKRTSTDERELRSFKKRLGSYDSAKESLSDSFFNGLLDEQDSE